MKIKFLHIILSSIVLALLTGCYQDIDLDKYKEQDGEHLLTINSIVNPDSIVAASATRTFFYSDTHGGKDYVKDLKLTLYVNGVEKGLMKYNSLNNLYESSYRPNENDIINLRTEYLGQVVECSDTIPSKVKIESIEIERQGPMHIYFDNDYIITYKITLSDPIGKDNYYFLRYDDVLSGKNLSMGERDYTYEFVFQQLANHINAVVPGWEPYSSSGLPFSDYGIDGTIHTLIVKEIVSSHLPLSGWSEMKRKIKLYSISKSYYLYLISRLYNTTENSGLHGGMIDMGVTEPMKYYSNIQGGVGILGGYSLDETEIDVIQIIGRFP